MPPEPETRPTLLEHLTSDDGELVAERPRVVAPPEPAVEDERPTFRQHLLEEKPSWIRVRASRVTKRQWLTALGICLVFPTLSYIWSLITLWADHNKAQELEHEWAVTVRDEDYYVSHERHKQVEIYLLKGEQRKIAQKVKDRWATWKAAFIGPGEPIAEVCYHGDTFQNGKNPGGTYRISCYVGAKGKLPSTKVDCTPASCQVTPIVSAPVQEKFPGDAGGPPLAE